MRRVEKSAVVPARDRSGWVRRIAIMARSGGLGGIALILASVAALIWSNSDASASYRAILSWRIGPPICALPVQQWVNDGLMSVFFLLVGLEIRREMTDGHLSTWQRRAGPAVAALGGMILPALIYLALTHAHEAEMRGWAVPIATDIAFSLAVLRLAGRQGRGPIRLFLTAIAILDDLGAIVVIGLFYTQAVHATALAGAVLAWLLLLAMARSGQVRTWPYLAGGVVLWGLLVAAGIQPTLAGVALAVVMPAECAHRLERNLEPVVAFLVLPVFGLANAGLDLHLMRLSTLVLPAPLGVILGLCVGKQAGVFGAAMLGRRLKLLTLPSQMHARDVYGAALLCGIGFTMSLFIGDLAFRGSESQAGIKLAVLTASVISALAGLAFLKLVPPPRRRQEAAAPGLRPPA
jgi:NhaA family Na+:H+ antiporter